MTLLVFELTKKKSLALVTMGMMAISPWAIQFSRVGFETQIAADFNIIMVYLFVKGLQKNYLLPLSAIFGVLTIYIYQSEKVFMPLQKLKTDKYNRLDNNNTHEYYSSSCYLFPILESCKKIKIR
jgi:hypothetical protein